MSDLVEGAVIGLGGTVVLLGVVVLVGRYPWLGLVIILAGTVAFVLAAWHGEGS